MTNNLMNIRQLREAHGMTQEDLAKRVGVTPPAVSKWERGLSFPSVGKVALMAEIFGVSMDVVMGVKSASA